MMMLLSTFLVFDVFLHIPQRCRSTGATFADGIQFARSSAAPRSVNHPSMRFSMHVHACLRVQSGFRRQRSGYCQIANDSSQCGHWYDAPPSCAAFVVNLAFPSGRLICSCNVASNGMACRGRTMHCRSRLADHVEPMTCSSTPASSIAARSAASCSDSLIAWTRCSAFRASRAFVTRSSAICGVRWSKVRQPPVRPPVRRHLDAPRLAGNAVPRPFRLPCRVREYTVFGGIPPAFLASISIAPAKSGQAVQGIQPTVLRTA